MNAIKWKSSTKYEVSTNLIVTNSQIGIISSNYIIKDCVSRILTELEQRIKYMEFITQVPEQVPLAVNPSTKGDKILYDKIG